MHGHMNIKLVFHIYHGTINKVCSLFTNIHTLCGKNAEFVSMKHIYILKYLMCFIRSQLVSLDFSLT